MNPDTTSSTTSPAFTYDEVPYPILTFSQTHPDLLSTMGRFSGMDPTDPTRCRVLEVGCGSGANLLFMAHSLPQSEFIGIDLSQVHIDRAKDTAKALRIKNAEFEQMDITELEPERIGHFDYVVAHGIYSWVPEEVRKNLLRVYSECLANNGIGFISYNSYPGCHIRQMIWEPMLYHVSGINSWSAKVNEARKFLAALANAAQPDSTFRAVLLEELKRIVEKPAEVVFHDDLESINQPFYFHEFMAEVRPFGLKFLAEANAKWLNMATLTPEAQGFLKLLESDVERREQYLDFIRCSRFRNALLCRREVQLVKELSLERFNKYFISAEIAPVSTDEEINNAEPKRFNRPDGANLSIDHPLSKAVLVYLGERWPHRVHIEEALTEASKMVDACGAETISEEMETTIKCLADSFTAGYVELHSYQPTCTYTLSERPVANPFSRWQAEAGATSISALNETVLQPSINLFAHLIPLLDGTRSKDDLIEEIKTTVKVPPEKAEDFIKNIRGIVQANLTVLAQSGLLVA